MRTWRMGNTAVASVAGLLMLSAPVGAHHGTGISYQMDKPITMTVVVTEFRYANPHPTIFFDYTNEKGQVEKWATEMITNPSWLMRAGWTKSRSVEALKPGAKVTVTLFRSKAGGNTGAVGTILNERGEEILKARSADNTLGQGAQLPGSPRPGNER